MGLFWPPGVFSFVVHKPGSNTPHTVGIWSHSNQGKPFDGFWFFFHLLCYKPFYILSYSHYVTTFTSCFTGQRSSEVDIIHHHYHNKMYEGAYHMLSTELSTFQKLTHFNLITTLEGKCYTSYSFLHSTVCVLRFVSLLFPKSFPEGSVGFVWKWIWCLLNGELRLHFWAFKRAQDPAVCWPVWRMWVLLAV